MTPPLIPNSTARRLFLQCQGLCRPPRKALANGDLEALVAQMGFVQVDSINTVERAHHLILFSRSQSYRHRQLSQLIERDAALFENWTHDAAIIPSRFYPYWRPRFARERARLRERWRKWRRRGFEEMLDGVRARIRDGGPVMARQLGDGPQKGTPNGPQNGTQNGPQNGTTGWWDWHPAKTALEYLWRTGELAVARREGFQKVYDLAERVIPERHQDFAPSEAAYIDWACRGAFERLGVATAGECAGFWGGLTPGEAAAWCRAHLGEALAEVLVEPAEGGKPRPAYALHRVLDGLGALAPPPGRVRVLSPFDPVLRDRARSQRLFGFNYRIEVFVPEAKRQYGYYVFPLLEGARFIGRIDMKHERQTGALRVKGLWLEPGCKAGRGRLDALDAELERLRRFTGAARVAFDDGYRKTAG